MNTADKYGFLPMSRRKGTRVKPEDYQRIAIFVVDNPQLVVKQVAARYNVSPAVVYKALADYTEMKRTLKLKPPTEAQEPIGSSDE